MLRSVFAGLGFTSKATPVARNNPFSKSTRQMLTLPSVLLTKPLRLSTVYPATTKTQTRAIKSQGRDRLFDENNPNAIKNWLTNYFKPLNLDIKLATLSRYRFDEGQQFIGINHDPLINNLAVVYPRDANQYNAWAGIKNQAQAQHKPSGVLELTKDVACWKAMFSDNFWVALVPHDVLRRYINTKAPSSTSDAHQRLNKK